MPRKSRVLVEGGYYHIMTRGNDRRKLFRNKQDYVCFLRVIKKYLAKFQVSIIHYCLMPNHLHLLMQVHKAGDLPKFMQAILQVYADYFKKKYGTVGFIFQNRYKSFLVDSESYLIECGRYIERNPLRSDITDNLLDYSWSSFGFYVANKHNDVINLVDPSYLDLAQTPEERQQLYRRYVCQERPYDLIVDKSLRI